MIYQTGLTLSTTKPPLYYLECKWGAVHCFTVSPWPCFQWSVLPMHQIVFQCRHFPQYPLARKWLANNHDRLLLSISVTPIKPIYSFQGIPLPSPDSYLPIFNHILSTLLHWSFHTVSMLMCEFSQSLYTTIMISETMYCYRCSFKIIFTVMKFT